MRLFDISSASERQFSLFAGQDDARSRLLMETVDRLNQVYGRNAVFLGCTGIAGSWRMKRDRLRLVFHHHLRREDRDLSSPVSQIRDML